MKVNAVRRSAYALALLLAGCSTQTNSTVGDALIARGTVGGILLGSLMKSGKPSQAEESTVMVQPGTYGPGVNADQYGRPHTYRLKDGQQLDPIYQNNVKRNAYGTGVHMDQFGRPVYDSAP